MKLIYAIVNNDDSHSVAAHLSKDGFQVTKIASTVVLVFCFTVIQLMTFFPL